MSISMTAPGIRSLLNPLTGTFSGWRMLLMSAIAIYCAAPGMTYGTAAFVDPLTSELGISRSLFSTAYAVATLSSAVVLLLIGKKFDLWGSRRLMTISIVGLAIGLVWLSFSNAAWAIFVGFALTRTFGQGILPLATRILIPHWFLRQRGRAYSIIGICGTLSVASMPPVHEVLIRWFGWRETWRLDAFLLTAILALLVWRVVRDRPEDLGQHQDGHVAEPGRAMPMSDADLGTTLADARKTFAFWTLLFASLVPMGIVTGLSLYQVGIYENLGFPSSLGGLTFTIESISMFVATVVIGARLDRLPLRIPLFLSQVLLLLGMVLLVTSSSLLSGVIYAIVRGASGGMGLITADVAWASWYGRKHLGSIRGFATAIGVFISALGPLPFGFAIDRFGSYTPAIVAMMTLPILCGTMVLLARPPHRA